MSMESRGSWQPETDADYGQVLVRHLLTKYRFMLLYALALGGIAAIVVSLFLPPQYSSKATIIVDKGGGSASSLLGGFSFLGGGNSALENEIQVLESREIAKEVIDELGLQVEVIDFASPDMTHNRILSKLFLGPKNIGPRNQIYSRLRIKDVEVDPDMLQEAKFDLIGTASGWKAKGKTGADGEPLELGQFRFTPVFGAGHKPGQSYRLVVKPDWDVFKDFDHDLGVSQVNDNATVITVSYRHRNPYLCTEVVNLVVEKYLARYAEKTTGDYDLILSYINDEIELANEQILEVVAELDEYREKNKLYEPSAQAVASIQAIADLSRGKSENQIQRKQLESLLKNMDAKTPQEVSKVIQSPINPLPIDQLLVERLANSIASLESLRQTQTDAHPDVIRVQASISLTLDQIKDSLSASVAQLDLATSQLAVEISQQRGQLLNLPAAESKIALLTTELQVNNEILAMLKRSEAETKLIRQETSTDIELLDGAIVPIKPSSPRLGKNAFLGAIAGIILAILIGLALEGGDSRISSLREIRLAFGQRILAVVEGPSIKGKWQPTDSEAEIFKRLANLLGVADKQVALVHLHGSAGGYDLAWGLAGAKGTAGKPGLLIDGDSLATELCSALGREAGVGLAELAAGSTQVENAVIGLDEARSLLPPGSGEWDASRISTALKQLGGRFATRLVCLPHPARWAGQAEVVKAMGQVVLVMPQQGSDRASFGQALDLLAGWGIKPAGVVVTNYSTSRDSLGRKELAYVSLGDTKA